ncbi:hypothetical protein HPG69_013766 [Diceros bicornis minor]|uniref:Uncharacterized protein n=1 Tax=Diceros bicornis minor TaxID=77932 RepID=A0A7J7FES5_DICBM|nr:hypothetical protein HPG69_013766 [Diceros bicornis minor]
MFSISYVGKTLVTRTQGTKIAADDFKAVFLKKFKLITEDVLGKNCLAIVLLQNITIRFRRPWVCQSWKKQLQGAPGNEIGAKVDRADGHEPLVQESVENSDIQW